uniref:glycerol kinase n=1 Tax=uncultured organism MedDCM-OCT-S01-C81 TaxID=743603 RepID=D6PJL3_9ZZZZ|nr:glycerol kinase [uncultured organism MedDCM-OCT-S01-C81]
MDKRTVLAIDQGTTGTTVLVIAMESGVPPKILGRGYFEFQQYFPQPGWVEHDLEEIWDSTKRAVNAAIEAADVQPTEIATIGITNQRETSGVWTKAGKPLHRAIVWQDRRTTEACETLRQAGHEALFREKTGLVLDPYFSGTKLAWLFEHVEEVKREAEAGNLCFGTIDTWLIYKLTGHQTFVTDVTNASRTLMFDIHKEIWDDELLDTLGHLPANILPAVRSSSEVYGRTEELGFLPNGIPVAGLAGDQQAALFGQGCFREGMAKCTYGTGAFALINTGGNAVESNHRLLTTIAWKIGEQTTYALEGSCFVAGAVVQWLRDGLGFFESSSEIEELARSVPDAGGVSLVPALTGLGAPHWRPDARGILCGLSRGTTRGHIARAALEGIAFQVYDLLDAMRDDSGKPIASLRVDGGASANDLLMQFQADLMNVEIHRPTILDTTALGAGYLAALGVGLFSDLREVEANWTLDRTYSPTGDAEKMKGRIQNWHHAVKRSW